jgi:uncharacterized protein YfbU (UPF0304 family)
MQNKLTRVERLMLLNQYLILSKLDQDSDYYEANVEILSQGYEYDYDSLFGSINENPVSEEICEETIDILNMFRSLNNASYSISEEQKSELGEGMKKLKFQGFDANNDKHYFYTKFMVEKLGKWDELNSVYLNSHNISTIDTYRKMLKEFNSSNLKKYNSSFDDLKNFISKI